MIKLRKRYILDAKDEQLDGCEELKTVDGRQETIKALTTAIETMEAFWCEKFGEDEDDEIH